MHDVSDTVYDGSSLEESQVAEIQNEGVKKCSIKDIVHQCNGTKGLYYSIEITPKANCSVNFDEMTVKPIFTSITWISGSNLKYGTIKKCPAVNLTAKLSQNCPVLNHVTCFKLSEKNANDFQEIGIQNLLILKGDEFENGQKFKYASELVDYFKKKDQGNKMTIAVAATMPMDDQSLVFLKGKVC
jgi:5,10-methylenetetrahydrofolate reductase